MEYYGSVINPMDGRIYLAPRNASQASRFDPVTKSWASFGNVFPVTKLLATAKYIFPVLSSVDNCMYAFPTFLNVVHR